MSEPYTPAPDDPPRSAGKTLSVLALVHVAVCCAPLLILLLITAGVLLNPWLLTGVAALVVTVSALAIIRRGRDTRATQDAATTSTSRWQEEASDADRRAVGQAHDACRPPWLPFGEDSKQGPSTRPLPVIPDSLATRSPTTSGE